MNFYQTRKTNAKKVIALTVAGDGKPWPADEVCLTNGTGPCNVLDFFKTFIAVDTTYQIGENRYKGQRILSLVEAYQEQYDGEYPRIVSGNHRGAAYVLGVVLGLDMAEPVLEDVEGDPDKIGLEANTRHDLVERLSAIDTLNLVVKLREKGEIQRESDLAALDGFRPTKGGRSNKAVNFFAKAELVCLHGIKPEVAVALSQKEAQKAKNAGNPREYINSLGEEPKQAKALTQKELVALSALTEQKNCPQLTAFVEAIRTGAKATAENCILELASVLESATEAVEAEVEATL